MHLLLSSKSYHQRVMLMAPLNKQMTFTLLSNSADLGQLKIGTDIIFSPQGINYHYDN